MMMNLSHDRSCFGCAHPKGEEEDSDMISKRFKQAALLAAVSTLASVMLIGPAVPAAQGQQDPGETPINGNPNPYYPLYGSFTDGHIVVTLQNDPKLPLTMLGGSVQLNGQTYPLTATPTGGGMSIKGEFTAPSGKYGFTMNYDNRPDVIVFATGTTEYRMHSVAPLEALPGQQPAAPQAPAAPTGRPLRRSRWTHPRRSPRRRR